MCLTLCSKFAKIRLSTGLHWGNLQRSPGSPSWIVGEGRKGEIEWQEGWEGAGEEGRGSGMERKGGVSTALTYKNRLRALFLITALNNRLSPSFLPLSSVILNQNCRLLLKSDRRHLWSSGIKSCVSSLYIQID